MKRFGEVMKEARKGLGLTLEAVAKSTSTHKGYISGIEHGKVNAPAANLTRRLARKLGLDPEEMVAIGYWEKRPEGVTLELLKRVVVLVLIVPSFLLF